jgi:hypothetical protein
MMVATMSAVEKLAVSTTRLFRRGRNDVASNSSVLRHS